MHGPNGIMPTRRTRESAASEKLQMQTFLESNNLAGEKDLRKLRTDTLVAVG